MLTEEDKARVQKMRDMVEATHWIKGALKKPLEVEYEDDGWTCKIDPDTGDYVSGKWGHCLMGLVAEVCGINVRQGGAIPSKDDRVFESRLAKGDLPEAVRITEALYENLGQYYHQRYQRYTNLRVEMDPITKKALLVESYNDALSTHKEDILNLLDKTLAA